MSTPESALWFHNFQIDLTVTAPQGTILSTPSAMLRGDFDGDGDVDGDDFLRWQSGFGTENGATKMDGDADGDGDVDGDDFLIWQAEFNPGNGTASAAVPEPTSVLLMLGVAVVGMCARRRRVR